MGADEPVSVRRPVSMYEEIVDRDSAIGEPREKCRHRGGETVAVERLRPKTMEDRVAGDEFQRSGKVVLVEALGQWLATPPRPFALEFEGLLRVYLAPFGSRNDLLAALESVQTQAEVMLGVGSEFRRSYLDGTSPFMDQVHIRALLNDFLLHYAELVRQWSERSLATVQAWPDLAPDGKMDAALATFAGLPAAAADQHTMTEGEQI